MKGVILLKNQISTKTSGISVKIGTHAMEYAAYAGGFVLITALGSELSTTSDPNYAQEDGNPGAIIVGFTAAGAVFASLIGVVVPRWKTLSNFNIFEKIPIN